MVVTPGHLRRVLAVSGLASVLYRVVRRLGLAIHRVSVFTTLNGHMNVEVGHRVTGLGVNVLNFNY